MNHFIALQQNNSKCQVFFIIASLGGGGWDGHQIVFADVPVAPGAVYIHHEEETEPWGLLKDPECILWDSAAEESDATVVTGTLLEVQTNGK